MPDPELETQSQIKCSPALRGALSRETRAKASALTGCPVHGVRGAHGEVGAQRKQLT